MVLGEFCKIKKGADKLVIEVISQLLLFITRIHQRL